MFDDETINKIIKSNIKGVFTESLEPRRNEKGYFIVDNDDED